MTPSPSWRPSSTIARPGKREKRTINTRNILFIMSGAFNGLDEIVKKRLSRDGNRLRG